MYAYYRNGRGYSQNIGDTAVSATTTCLVMLGIAGNDNQLVDLVSNTNILHPPLLLEGMTSACRGCSIAMKVEISTKYTQWLRTWIDRLSSVILLCNGFH